MVVKNIVAIDDEVGRRKLEDINYRVQKDESIPYREHIRVISSDQFKTFLGMDIAFDESFLEDFNGAVSLARDGVYSNIQMEKLLELWAESLHYFDSLSQTSLLGWNYFNKLFRRTQ